MSLKTKLTLCYRRPRVCLLLLVVFVACVIIIVDKRFTAQFPHLKQHRQYVKVTPSALKFNFATCCKSVWPKKLTMYVPPAVIMQMNCSQVQPDVLQVYNGRMIAAQGHAKHQHVPCGASEISRYRGDVTYMLGRKETVYSRNPVPADMFKLSCINKDSGHLLQRLYAGVQRHRHLRFHNPARQIHESHDQQLNFILLALDSLSADEVTRYLPHTWRTFLKRFTGVPLRGFNLVDTDTILLPLLTGIRGSDLGDFNRTGSRANKLPWLWNHLEQLSYANQWIEEQPETRMWFLDPPVHHYYRAYMQAVSAERANKSSYCTGAQLQVDHILDVVKEMFRVYSERSKFSLVRLAELRYRKMDVRMLDRPLENFLHWLLDNEFHKNTLLLVFSDHHGVPLTGRPLMSLALPKYLSDKYPQLLEEVRNKMDEVTSAFDVRRTIYHILGLYKNLVRVLPTPKFTVGSSLVSSWTMCNSCRMSGITEHWCTACPHTQFHSVHNHKNMIQQAATAVVNYMNEQTEYFRKICVLQTLQKVVSSEVFQSSGSHGLVELQFNTHPRNASFRVTVVWEEIKNNVKYKFLDSQTEITRLDSQHLGQTFCVEKYDVHLRELCSCV